MRYTFADKRFNRLDYISLSKYDHRQHFESFLSVYGMRMSCRHHDTLPFFQKVFLAVYRDFAYAVNTSYEGVSAKFVRVDFFSLVKGEKRYAQRVVLRKRLADDLSFPICRFVLERKHFGFGYLFYSRYDVLPRYSLFTI